MITLIEPGNHGEEKSPSTHLSLSLHLPKDFKVKVFAKLIGLRKPLSKQMYKLYIVYDNILSIVSLKDQHTDNTIFLQITSTAQSKMMINIL